MFHRHLLSSVLLLGVVLPTFGQQEVRQQLTSLVDEDTLLVGVLDLKQLDVNQVFDTLSPLMGFTVSSRDKFKAHLTTFKQALKAAGATHVYCLFTNREFDGTRSSSCR